MATMYCALCGRPVEATRQIGVGTVFLAVFTLGLSLLAIPFYRKRCPICRSTAVSMTMPDGVAPGGRGAGQARIVELEQRLRLTESELEATGVALDRVRTERDFYRQLLGDPARRRGRGGEAQEPGPP